MTDRPARALLGSLTVIVAAATAPAGVSGQPVPWWAWSLWTLSASTALVVLIRAGCGPADALRRTVWLAPVAAVFALPAAALAPPGTRLLVAAALLCRAWSAAALGAATATALGPGGLACGLRDLGVPARLADVFEATLVSLAAVVRQVRSMLRAREARRPGFGAWSSVIARPSDTATGFGRLVASLLLRSLERAESLERARRARGGVA
jgi:energy-coupling factor transporter transmembrane protein EcfT